MRTRLPPNLTAILDYACEHYGARRPDVILGDDQSDHEHDPYTTGEAFWYDGSGQKCAGLKFRIGSRIQKREVAPAWLGRVLGRPPKVTHETVLDEILTIVVPGNVTIGGLEGDFSILGKLPKVDQ